jgi:hypothetical protein
MRQNLVDRFAIFSAKPFQHEGILAHASPVLSMVDRWYSNRTASLLVRSDPIIGYLRAQPHECGHYEQERVETESDGLLSEKWRCPANEIGAM